MDVWILKFDSLADKYAWIRYSFNRHFYTITKRLVVGSCLFTVITIFHSILDFESLTVESVGNHFKKRDVFCSSLKTIRLQVGSALISYLSWVYHYCEKYKSTERNAAQVPAIEKCIFKLNVVVVFLVLGKVDIKGFQANQ